MTRALLDTSVVIAPPDPFEVEAAISTLTLAELSTGPLAARSPADRAERLSLLQRVESTFNALPFDLEAAHAFGRVYAAAHTAGRPSRRRMVDLMIASVALANGLPVYTRNPGDFRGLDKLVGIVGV